MKIRRTRERLAEADRFIRNLVDDIDPDQYMPPKNEARRLRDRARLVRDRWDEEDEGVRRRSSEWEANLLEGI